MTRAEELVAEIKATFREITRTTVSAEIETGPQVTMIVCRTTSHGIVVDIGKILKLFTLVIDVSGFGGDLDTEGLGARIVIDGGYKGLLFKVIFVLDPDDDEE